MLLKMHLFINGKKLLVAHYVSWILYNREEPKKYFKKVLKFS